MATEAAIANRPVELSKTTSQSDSLCGCPLSSMAAAIEAEQIDFGDRLTGL